MRLGTTLAIVAALGATACSDPAPKAKSPAEQPVAQPPATPAQPPASIPATASKITLIREGIGVGGVELGMTPADVERILGKPNQTNKAGDTVVFMGFREPENFGVYFDENRVRMLIVSLKKDACTDFDVCLYREGDLAKLKARHGKNLFRFVDRDGSITYRLLETKNGKQILTEYTPVEEKDGIVQVTIMTWTGKIDTSSFD